jgi:hypothetical protein
MKNFDKRLFVKLFFAFIAFTIIGTLSHEFGHFLAAKYYGFHARINYAYSYWETYDPNEIVSDRTVFFITLAGPLQTMLTGTIGLLLLFVFRNSFRQTERLSFKLWTVLFISLFWLRQLANFAVWFGSCVFTGQFSQKGDEIKLAHFLRLPGWSIITVTAIISVFVLTLIFFKFIPIKQRLTFILSGLSGGIAGYYLWLVLLGKYIMP